MYAVYDRFATNFASLISSAVGTSRALRHMHWAWPLVTLSVLLSCTTVFYHFRTPSTIAVGSGSKRLAPEAALASVWGAVDSDFDWCEHNNMMSSYVAEPLNSVTSAAYPILALFAWRTHHHLAVSPYLKLALVVTASVENEPDLATMPARPTGRICRGWLALRVA